MTKTFTRRRHDESLKDACKEIRTLIRDLTAIEERLAMYTNQVETPVGPVSFTGVHGAQFLAQQAGKIMEHISSAAAYGRVLDQEMEVPC